MGLLAAAAVTLALASPAPVVRSFALPAGGTTTRFHFEIYAGAFRAVRLRVPHGATVRVVARDAGRSAAVGTSTRPDGGGCWRSGRFDVCETPFEGCPVPWGRWNGVLVKQSRPAARVRVTFLFSRG